MAQFTMSKEERETFLAGVHVGVLSVADGAGQAPVQAPVWYAYEPGGDVRFTTGANSEKARLLRASGRASLCVQTETAPYSYVVVEGTVRIEEPDLERDAVAIAQRYLGERGGKAYVGSRTQEEMRRDSILVRITPERWRTTDYGKR